MMKELNLNSIVQVKLTDKGKDIYYHRFDEVNKAILANEGKPLTPKMPRVDANGYTSFHMHELMNLYGPHMILGAADTGIDRLVILIDEEDLKEPEKS